MEEKDDKIEGRVNITNSWIWCQYTLYNKLLYYRDYEAIVVINNSSNSHLAWTQWKKYL